MASTGALTVTSVRAGCLRFSNGAAGHTETLTVTGDLEVSAVGDLTFVGAVAVPGALIVDARGAVTTTGNLVSGGVLDVASAGTVSLAGALSAGGALDVAAVSGSGTERFDLWADPSTTITGASVTLTVEDLSPITVSTARLTVTTRPDASRDTTVNNGGDIDVTSLARFMDVGVDASGDVVLDAPGDDLFLRSLVGTDVTLRARNITQGFGALVAWGVLTLDGSQSATLTNAANDVLRLTANVPDSVLTFVSAGSLELGALTARRLDVTVGTGTLRTARRRLPLRVESAQLTGGGPVDLDVDATLLGDDGICVRGTSVSVSGRVRARVTDAVPRSCHAVPGAFGVAFSASRSVTADLELDVELAASVLPRVGSTYRLVTRSLPGVLALRAGSLPDLDGGLSWHTDRLAGEGLLVVSECGDGVVDFSEVCDDGNARTERECPYGIASCTRCDAGCSRELTLTGRLCGDGRADPEEACDDGNLVTEVECPYGVGSCAACDATCGAALTLAGRVCGDGTLDPEEVCDDGNAQSERECPYGVASCERCDATCSAPLRLFGRLCGDGIDDPEEACDDGGTVTETECPYGTAACSLCDATCRTPLALRGRVCGDGTTDPEEVCDDGNLVTETECPYGVASCMRCDARCGAEMALRGRVCGDGTTDPEEVCDDGNSRTELECEYGVEACVLCDGGCRTVLPLEGRVCGDDVVDPEEACDDGNTETETACPYGLATCVGCTEDCSEERALAGRFCGDGVLDPEETCDDGNATDGDGCSSACVREGLPDMGLVADMGARGDLGLDAGPRPEDAGVDAFASAPDADVPNFEPMGGEGCSAGPAPAVPWALFFVWVSRGHRRRRRGPL
ncbi:MAG: DUF4215 domain-containing protein [Myxococcota bacterium]